MTSLDLIPAILFTVAPLAIGLYLVVFNRQFSLEALRVRKAMWRMDFTETDVKAGRVLAFVLGVAFVIRGLIAVGEFWLS